MYLDESKKRSYEKSMNLPKKKSGFQPMKTLNFVILWTVLKFLVEKFIRRKISNMFLINAKFAFQKICTIFQK